MKKEPPFDDIKYCKRCCLPETAAELTFNSEGVCSACSSEDQKNQINWDEREGQLRELLEKYRGKSPSGYDCLVPMGGGKDSTFQLHVIVNVYKLRPLTVTFSHNWMTETGLYNFNNALEKFNVDNILFTPNRSLVNRLAKQSFYNIGDACWHCHAGTGAFPVQMAVKYNLPLMIRGESPAAFGRMSYDNPKPYTYEYFRDISAKKKPSEMVNSEIDEKELGCFQMPSKEELERVKPIGIHIGNYIHWDTERQVEFIKKEYGWKEDDVEGTYKRYKSVECIMEGAHSYMRYIKRGFGRASEDASNDVRTGRISREKGFELIRKHETDPPESLEKFLEITGITRDEFYKVLKEHRENNKLPDVL